MILPTNLHSATLPRLLFAEPTDYCLQPNPFALVWTGASAQRTKTPESDDLSSWGDATVHLTHINPMEALSIEIAQLQDVFHTQTLAKFMVDLSVLRSGVDHEMWVQAIGGYMTAEQERTYRKAQELFNGVDQDGNGLLDMDEVRALFESMNLEVTDEQHAKAYGEMDDDGNGEVDFDEFSGAPASPPASPAARGSPLSSRQLLMWRRAPSIAEVAAEAIAAVETKLMTNSTVAVSLPPCTSKSKPNSMAKTSKSTAHTVTGCSNAVLSCRPSCAADQGRKRSNRHSPPIGQAVLLGPGPESGRYPSAHLLHHQRIS